MNARCYRALVFVLDIMALGILLAALLSAAIFVILCCCKLVEFIGQLL